MNCPMRGLWMCYSFCHGTTHENTGHPSLFVQCEWVREGAVTLSLLASSRKSTRDVGYAAVTCNCKDREKDPPSINHTFMTDVCVKMLDEVRREVLELPPKHCGYPVSKCSCSFSLSSPIKWQLGRTHLLSPFFSANIRHKRSRFIVRVYDLRGQELLPLLRPQKI